MEFLYYLFLLSSVVYIALESRRTSMLLIDIMKDQQRLKEFVLGQYCIQVHTYNVLRLEKLEDELGKHSMYGSINRNEEIEEKISNIKEEIKRLRVEGYELETKEEQEYRKWRILNRSDK